MGAYHRGVLMSAGTAVIDAAIIFLIVVPIGGFLYFARWFMRRDDDGRPQ
jgi:hypothetical protein